MTRLEDLISSPTTTTTTTTLEVTPPTAITPLVPQKDSSFNSTDDSTDSLKPVDSGTRLMDANSRILIDNVRQLTHSGTPFSTDWLGTTSLHLAAKNGHLEAAQLLLKAGVCIDAKTKLERTALHMAAQEGRLEMIELLIKNGANVNARDMLRMTALHWSVERRHSSLVTILLENGAHVDTRNKFMLTPIEIAHENKFDEIVEIIESWNGKFNRSTSLSSQAINVSSKQSSHLTGVQLNHVAHNNLDGGLLTLNSILDSSREIPLIDLIGFDCHPIRTESDLFLQPNRAEAKNVEYLMKIIQDLRKENSFLRQKVEQLTNGVCI